MFNIFKKNKEPKFNSPAYWKRREEHKYINDIDGIRKILDKDPNADYPDNTGIFINGISYQRDTYVSGGSVFRYPRGMTWREFAFTQSREPRNKGGKVESYHDYEDSYDRRQQNSKPYTGPRCKCGGNHPQGGY